MTARSRFALFLAASLACPLAFAAPREDSTAAAEHGMIGAGKEDASSHTMHPDAQWYPDAAFGLFIHWGLYSVPEWWGCPTGSLERPEQSIPGSVL